MKNEPQNHATRHAPAGGTYVLLTLSAFFWGATFNAAKVALRSLTPLTIAATRFAIAGGLMAAVVVVREKNILATVRRNIGIFTFMALVGVVGFNAFFFFGMRYTSPTNAALIMATNPLITALLSSVLLGEAIHREHRVGMLLSALGVAILVTANNAVARVNVGDLYIMAANTCFALYAVAGKKYVEQSTPVMSTAAMMVLGAPVLWVLARIWEPHASVRGLPLDAYAAIFFMAVMGSVLAYLFWNHGLGRIGVANTTVFVHLVPVFTVVMSFVLHQAVSLVQLGAGVLVIVGVLISSGFVGRLLKRAATRRKVLASEVGQVAPSGDGAGP